MPLISITSTVVRAVNMTGDPVSPATLALTMLSPVVVPEVNVTLAFPWLSVVEEADFVFLSRQTELSAGNISSHMTRLEEAGYVKIDKTIVGKRPRTVYQLTDAGRAAFEQYRQQLAGLLSSNP